MRDEKQDIEEIKKAYTNEWLLITDYETDESTRVTRGKLVIHSKSRDEIHKKLSDYTGKRCIQYSGKLPKDQGVMF